MCHSAWSVVRDRRVWSQNSWRGSQFHWKLPVLKIWTENWTMKFGWSSSIVKLQLCGYNVRLFSISRRYISEIVRDRAYNIKCKSHMSCWLVQKSTILSDLKWSNLLLCFLSTHAFTGTKQAFGWGFSLSGFLSSRANSLVFTVFALILRRMLGCCRSVHMHV